MEWDFSKVFCSGPAFTLAGAEGSFSVDLSANRAQVWRTQQPPVTIRSRRVVEALCCVLRAGFEDVPGSQLVGSPDDLRAEPGQEHRSQRTDTPHYWGQDNTADASLLFRNEGSLGRAALSLNYK